MNFAMGVPPAIFQKMLRYHFVPLQIVCSAGAVCDYHSDLRRIAIPLWLTLGSKQAREEMENDYGSHRTV